VSTPLVNALGLGDREVVVLVGGGGKTTTLFRLGRELLSSRAGVVVTTTTHIFAPGAQPDLETIFLTEWDRGVADCRAARERGHLPVLGTHVTPERRLAGVPPEVVDHLSAQAEVRYVVVEADGSAHKPFKAPLDYEPVVPSSTTLLIAVVGVDALGQPLDAEHIHRPQRVAELSGASLGAPLTAETIASVLVHRLGPLRDAPQAARTLVLLNKADTPERLAAAHEIARAVRAHDGPATLIGAVAADVPFSETQDSP
jgi:molybdenum cofactor cytidylyltransferase